MKKIAIIVLMFTMVFSAMTLAADTVAKNDAVEKLCGSCHTTDSVYSAPVRSVQRWDSTYKRMVRNGLKATPEEEKAVKEYLYTRVP